MYNDEYPGALGYKIKTPQRLFFCHFDAALLYYLIPKTSSTKITEQEENCIWLPPQLRPVISLMAQPQFINSFESQIALQKPKRKKDGAQVQD